MSQQGWIGPYGRGVATWDDVRRLVSALPEVVEAAGGGTASWRVRGRPFVWERPPRRRPPADQPDVCFSTPHVDGYPAVLVQLERIDADDLAELVVEAWLDRAPTRLAAAYLAGHPVVTA